MGWAVVTENGIVLTVSLLESNILLPTGSKLVSIDDNTCTDILLGKTPLSHALGRPALPTTHVQYDVSKHVTCSGKEIDAYKWVNLLFSRVDYSLLKNRHFFIWDWRHRYGHEIAGAFPWTEFNNCRDLHINDRMSIILDNCMEAPDYYNHLKPLCDILNTINVANNNILFWATIDEPDNIPVRSINTNNGITIGSRHYITEPSTQTDSHFIMLAKNPRPLRIIIANEILKRNLDRFGNISCGSGQWWHDYENSPYIENQFKSQFPIILDGQIPDGSVKQHQVDDNRITNAAINIICETSQDSSLEGPILWTMPFITEKTGKAFALCQFPLMISVPNTVEKLRKLGFDLFDDIIDHSYDNEYDPFIRVKMVCDQLEKLCGIEDIGVFRQLHWERLINNRQTLLNLIKNTIPTNVIQLTKWLEDTQ